MSDRFSRFIDKTFFSLLVGVCSIVAFQLKSLNSSLVDLNIKMATIIERVSSQDAAIDEVKRDLRSHEEKPKH